MLNTLVSAGKKRKRIGRGGDRGGTSGRGHQGQGSRSGGSVGIIYEGGQMPLTRRLPKRGFNNAAFATTYEIVSLKALENNFDNGAVITKEILKEKGLIRGKNNAPVKILGGGSVTKKFSVRIDAISNSAAENIKKQGGDVSLTKEK